MYARGGKPLAFCCYGCYNQLNNQQNTGDLVAKKMKLMALLSSLITIFCAILYKNSGNDLFLTLMITFGTTAYHFVMRLFTGLIINLLLKNHVDYRKRWFQVSAIEQKLYKKLKVKKWKGKMGTYDPDCFDNKIHSWDEIAQATCQAELVHELIIVLSFVPVIAAVPFGALPVFIITSILAACVDAVFVIIQRYNRPRVIKFLNNFEKNKSKNGCP